MSKTVNPASYVIIHEWVFEYLCEGTHFSVMDVMNHVPTNEYRYEENFDDLYSTMIEYAKDEIKGISEEHGFDYTLCEELNDEEIGYENDLDESSTHVDVDSSHRLNIPKAMVNKLLNNTKNVLCLGCFGNEVIICEPRNHELNDAKKVVMCDVVKYNSDGSPYIRMNFDKYFNDPTYTYEVWYEDENDVIHIMN